MPGSTELQGTQRKVGYGRQDISSFKVDGKTLCMLAQALAGFAPNAVD